MRTRVEKLNGGKYGATPVCIHRLTGRVSVPKVCLWNYACESCAFDQWLDDVDGSIRKPGQKIEFSTADVHALAA